MLGFESFVAIVVVGLSSTSASEISAKPHLIPVARFLATGSYGSKCAVNPNRDSPNGYPTVTPTELQPVTLAH